jgi:hypothetical protein
MLRSRRWRHLALAKIIWLWRTTRRFIREDNTRHNNFCKTSIPTILLKHVCKLYPLVSCCDISAVNIWTKGISRQLVILYHEKRKYFLLMFNILIWIIQIRPPYEHLIEGRDWLTACNYEYVHGGETFLRRDQSSWHWRYSWHVMETEMSSQRKLQFSMIHPHVTHIWTAVSNEYIISIFRVENQQNK